MQFMEEEKESRQVINEETMDTVKGKGRRGQETHSFGPPSGLDAGQKVNRGA